MTLRAGLLPRVGVILLDTAFVRPPGDIGNAETFGGRALFERVPTATVGRVLAGAAEDDDLLAGFRVARNRLVARGAGMVTTSCGLLVFHQRPLQQDCPVPFTASALMQIELRRRQHGPVGVIALAQGSVTPSHLVAAGADPATPIGALAEEGHLISVLRANRPDLPIDAARATADLVEAGRDLLARYPGLRALVLECTNLPPYQDGLKVASGLPVYGFLDWLTAIHAGLAETDGTLT